MKQLRPIGFVLLAYGGLMLLLLLTPWRDWASDHSVVHLISRTNRRIGDEVNGKVDLLLSVVGDVAVMFVGLWFAYLLPRTMAKYAQMSPPPTTPASTPTPTPTPPPPMHGRTLPPPPPPSA